MIHNTDITVSRMDRMEFLTGVTGLEPDCPLAGTGSLDLR